MLPGVSTHVRMVRSEFEQLIAPAIDATVDAMRRRPGSAGLAPADLSAVLLVGGSSRIPLVAQRVSAELDLPVTVDSDPKAVVAIGAALAVSPRANTAVTSAGRSHAAGAAVRHRGRAGALRRPVAPAGGLRAGRARRLRRGADRRWPASWAPTSCPAATSPPATSCRPARGGRRRLRRRRTEGRGRPVDRQAVHRDHQARPDPPRRRAHQGEPRRSSPRGRRRSRTARTDRRRDPTPPPPSGGGTTGPGGRRARSRNRRRSSRPLPTTRRRWRRPRGAPAAGGDHHHDRGSAAGGDHDRGPPPDGRTARRGSAGRRPAVG